MDFSENGRRVRIGVIGLGGRGRGWVETLLGMNDACVAGVCDILPERLSQTMAMIREKQPEEAFATTRYAELLARQDVEAVLVCTSWQVHHRIATQALEAGRPVGLEVGGANSVQECWELVRASERSGKFCMLLANCCYGREEMALIRMARQGIFGQIVHCQGGYEHDRRCQIGAGDSLKHYRQINFTNRNGDLYPMHGLGYLAKILGINRGNRMLWLVSAASKAVGQHAWYLENRPGTRFVDQRIHEGDIVNTIIRCAQGETILLTHDCTLPRPYSRAGRVQGTKGLWMEDKAAYYLDCMRDETGGPSHAWRPFEEALAKYEHPLWRAFRASGRTGSHGGMDYLVMRAFIDTLQREAIPPVDVYDTALWTAITCLSEESIALGGPVAVPDFTNGRWMDRGADLCTTAYTLDPQGGEGAF